MTFGTISDVNQTERCLRSRLQKTSMLVSHDLLLMVFVVLEVLYIIVGTVKCSLIDLRTEIMLRTAPTHPFRMV